MIGAPAVALAVGVAALVAPLAVGGAPQLPAPIWTDADGTPVRLAVEAIIAALRDGEVIDRARFDEGGRPRAFDDTAEGHRGTYRVRLRQGDLELAAIFRSIDDRVQVAHFEDGTTAVHFRDFGLFECAAYELGRALGVDHVLPATVRRIGNVDGCLQLHLVDAFNESDRAASGRDDPAPQRWNMQLLTMNVFDALIGNADRNRQNLLYDAAWRVWLTDHTRAFTVDPRVDLAPLQAIEAGLWQGLGVLEPAAIEAIVGTYLTGGETEALLERRARLLRHFDGLIEERGEAGVVYHY